MLNQFTSKAWYLMAISLFLSLINCQVIPEGLGKRDDGFIKLDFTKILKSDNSSSSGPPIQSKRSGYYDYAVKNEGLYYIADLYLGSNSQKVSVDIDTGSSDLWVVDSSAPVDATYGTYDPNASSSYQYINSDFAIGYADKSYAYGDYVTDKVALSPNGPVIPSLEFGDAGITSIKYGILGIGFSSLEAASTKYPNLPVQLKNNGFIKKTAYSLYLNSATASTGSVLFGGIDHAKYSGTLGSLPITSTTRLNVKLDSVTWGGSSESINDDVTLDSGSSISYLKSDILKDFLGTKLGASYHEGSSDSSAYYYFNSDEQCASLGEYEVNFDGITIKVPLSDITSPLLYTNGKTAPGCIVLVLPEDDFNILGDNFLRNAYAVYDLDDTTISLAQVKYTSEENISVIS